MRNPQARTLPSSLTSRLKKRAHKFSPSTPSPPPCPQVDGASDLEKVRKLQDGYKVTPLSIWGKRGAKPPPPPPQDPKVRRFNEGWAAAAAGRLFSSRNHGVTYPILSDAIISYPNLTYILPRRTPRRRPSCSSQA